MQIKIQTLTCPRCKYTWVPRTAVVKMCPGCKCRNWEKPAKFKRKKHEKEI